MPLPRYRSHKEVRALKIKEVQREQMPVFKRPTCKGCFALGSACGRCERCDFERVHGSLMGITLVFEHAAYDPLKLDAEYIRRNGALLEVGGYYVVHDNGYASYSPANAFEAGFTLLPQDGN